MTYKDELFQVISSQSFFSDLTQKELEVIVGYSKLETYKAGDIILHRGEIPTAFYLLVEGEVEVYLIKMQNMQLSIPIELGNTFGEMGLVDRLLRSSTCFCTKDGTRVLRISIVSFDELSTSLQLKLSKKMNQILAQRLRCMNERFTKVMQTILKLPQKPLLEQELAQEERQIKVEDDATAPKKEEKSSTLDQNKEEVKRDVTQESLVQEALGKAQEVKNVVQMENYDTIVRKIYLRSDFILSKIPPYIVDYIHNFLCDYWTGAGGMKNPHGFWDRKVFLQGTSCFARSFHLVVVCPYGDYAFSQIYEGFPLSHRVIGLYRHATAGTFLGSSEAIERYFRADPLETAVQYDLIMPIDREHEGEECIELLTHTCLDVHENTLLFVFEDHKGKYTQMLRKKYPRQQILSVVSGFGFDLQDKTSLFRSTKRELEKQELLFSYEKFQGLGYYQKETLFLSDLFAYYEGDVTLRDYGSLFGIIALLSKMGPELSGIAWGSLGGAAGVFRAVQAYYGDYGSRSERQTSLAVRWADKLRKK